MADCNTAVAELWDDVYRAVMDKHQKPEKFMRIYIGKIEMPANSPVHMRKKGLTSKRLQRQFLLSSPLENIPLTRRERQVLYLICQGATNREVANNIGLSARTVEYYIKNMRKKTLAASKANLIKLVLKTNFFDRIGKNILSE